MKRLFSFLLIIACTASFISPESLEGLLEPDILRQLRDKSSVSEMSLKNPVLKLTPKIDEIKKFVSASMNEIDPNLAVETLYIYKKPARSGGSAWNGAQRTGLFNQLLALSTLAGIQYYSASRKTMRTFYEISHVIDSPNAKKSQPDPVFASPPASFAIYARQKDLTFGDNVYRYEYRTMESAFYFSQENMTALNAGIIPAIGKNKLRTVMAVIDCGDSLLIYAVSAAKAASVFGMGDRIGNSFGNRAQAVYDWFSARADIVFAE